MAFKLIPAEFVLSGNFEGAYTLTGQYMQSPNYAPGVAGWSIFGDGSAEFNNLTLRGEFHGTDYLMTSAGLFMYSGPV